jgi:hypothetical protein
MLLWLSVIVRTTEFAKDPRLRADLHHLPNQSRTLAVGLNPTDWKHALGPWNPPNKSCVVGCDSAGEVVAVGSNVTHVKKGDKVFGFVFGTSDPYNGSYAEYVRFNKAVVVKIPDGMSAVEAASFPVRSLARSLAECLHLRWDADLGSLPRGLEDPTPHRRPGSLHATQPPTTLLPFH